MTNIVTTWLGATLTPDKSVKQVATELGAAVGMVITTSRLREWEQGRRGLPAAVYNHMLKAALAVALEEEGFVPNGSGAMARLAVKLNLPDM